MTLQHTEQALVPVPSTQDIRRIPPDRASTRRRAPTSAPALARERAQEPARRSAPIEALAMVQAPAPASVQRFRPRSSPAYTSIATATGQERNNNLRTGNSRTTTPHPTASASTPSSMGYRIFGSGADSIGYPSRAPATTIIVHPTSTSARMRSPSMREEMGEETAEEKAWERERQRHIDAEVEKELKRMDERDMKAEVRRKRHIELELDRTQRHIGAAVEKVLKKMLHDKAMERRRERDKEMGDAM
ncbi:hypothetical protein EDC01DRAFT_665531 [Geopyxis carbonaria]|nr:hypothetical protein EDC01DRAFT_665531 [Geopyxis carbonaria]